jgi:hypothetical protein
LPKNITDGGRVHKKGENGKEMAKCGCKWRKME